MKDIKRHLQKLSEVRMGDWSGNGGKNASLGEMIQNLIAQNIKVPNGFAVTVNGYDAFIDEKGLNEKINAALEGLDITDSIVYKKGHSCRVGLLDFSNFTRRLGYNVSLCLLLTLTCVNRGASQTQKLQASGPWPTIAWSVVKPEAVGMDRAALKEAEQIYPRLFPSGYSLLVIRHGSIVSESYYHSQTAATSNHVFSITKTFAATLLGIAVRQGWIDGVEHRVADLLPQYPVNPKLAQLTLEDVLTHRSGVRNRADVSLLLNEEPQSPPGTAFKYSDSAPNLLTAILDRLAKQGTAGATDVSALAQKYLFDPVGINISEWKKGLHGVPEGGNGLHMTSRDMARLGYLLLRDGRWEDEQLLPTGWVQAATEHRVEVDREKGYGYLIWVRRRPDIVRTTQGDRNVQGYFAYGHRGQFIGVYPELDLLVVTTADATDATRDTYFVPDLLHDFVRRFVFPAITQSQSSPVKK